MVDVVSTGPQSTPAESAGLAARLTAVRERVARAARRVGRDPSAITIVGVTKTVPLATVVAAVALDLADVGENRVQEAEEKIRGWGAAAPDLLQPRWHLIGHLQTNKARLAVQLFDVIHSVDSLRLAQAVSQRAEQLGRVVPILLEVNLSGEASKFGFAPDEVVAAVPAITTLGGIRIAGLMTIGAPVEDPEATRPTFRALRELRDQCRARFPTLSWEALSMGMTHDFEIAIEEGATHVRIGRAIFGERPAPR